MVSSGASSPPSGGPFAPSEVVREIGHRPHPVYVVRNPATTPGGKPQLAIAERFEGGARSGDAAGEQLLRDARRIATLASPNLARVKEVLTRGDDMVVLTEFIEGEKLQELWHSRRLPLEIALRVIVDVLAGVGAIHGLRDAKQQPMKLAHGELSPATIVLGLDGVARLLHAIARCAPSASPEAASLGYLAPEVLVAEPYDARADVFGAGVLLWEALSGKRLVAESDVADVARRIRRGAVPPATVPDKAAWAKALVPVATKALASTAEERWPTVAALAAEIRKAAGLKLAPASAAAAFARSAMGEKVKARRESLEGAASSSSPAPAPVVQASEPPISIELTDDPSVPPPARVPSESVLVVPGIRAEVAEVVELESSLLMPAPESIPPPGSSPATSSAIGGFVLDPFAAAATLAKAAPLAQPSPAALPVAFVAAPIVVRGPPARPPEPVTGAPHFAAAIDVVQPPGRAAVPTSQEGTLATSSDEPFEVGNPAARRRKLLVLGGVAVLGATIFALAAVRLAGREPDVSTRPSVANAQAGPPLATPPAPATLPSSPATSAAPTPAPAPATAPTAVATQPPTPPIPAVAQPATAQAPTPRAAPQPAPVAAAPTAATPARVVPATAAAAPAPKPRPKPTFDPNSL